MAGGCRAIHGSPRILGKTPRAGHRSLRLELLVVLAVVAVSCSGPKNPEVESHRAIWEQKGVASYSFIYSSGSALSGDEDRTITVREGHNVSVIPPWQEQRTDKVETVDDLFRTAARVYDQPGEGGRSVTFDPTYGFPTQGGYHMTSIDGHPVIDDDWSFSVRSFQVVDR